MRPHPLVTAAALGAGGCVAYGVAVERRWYAVRHERLGVLRSPGRLRLLAFTDLHQRPGQEHRLAFVRDCVTRFAPDVIISGGDNLESDAAIDDVVAVHAAVRGDRPGVAVLGAHDFFGPVFKHPLTYLTAPERHIYGRPLDTARLVAGLREAGWQVLENTATVLSTPAGVVEVLGLGDAHMGHADLSAVPAAPLAADPALRLGVLHAPYRAPLTALDAAGFDLAVAGHTHGGQVRVPWLGALVSNTDLPLAQARGTSWWGAGLTLHVSAGLGHSTFAPFRFACRPELSVLDLVPALAHPTGGG